MIEIISPPEINNPIPLPPVLPFELPVYFVFLAISITLSLIIITYLMKALRVAQVTSLEQKRLQHKTLMILGSVLFAYNILCFLMVMIISIYRSKISPENSFLYLYTFGLTFILFSFIGLAILILKPIFDKKRNANVQTLESDISQKNL